MFIITAFISFTAWFHATTALVLYLSWLSTNCNHNHSGGTKKSKMNDPNATSQEEFLPDQEKNKMR